MDPTVVSQRIIKDLKSIQNRPFENDEDRIRVKDAVMAALPQLETPWETAYRLAFIQPALMAVLKTCHDLKLFKKWGESGGGPKDVNELVKLVGIDPLLLDRLLRHLSSTHIISEVSAHKYAPTKFSLALAKPGFGSIIPFCSDETLPGHANLPDYLRSINYQNPSDPSKSNWHHLKGISHFEEIKRHPLKMANFQNVMSEHAARKISWTELYPVQDLISACKNGTPLVVDVGGGKGHDLEKLRLKYPNLPPGSLVLQDQGLVVQSAAVHKSIQTMAYNFFTPQPVKGATAYYLHNVLHKWKDGDAIKILRNVAAALERDYSKVFVHEIIVHEFEPTAQMTSSDLQMMMALTAMERTKAMWDALFASARLKCAKVWSSPVSTESVLEVVPK